MSTMVCSAESHICIQINGDWLEFVGSGSGCNTIITAILRQYYIFSGTSILSSQVSHQLLTDLCYLCEWHFVCPLSTWGSVSCGSAAWGPLEAISQADQLKPLGPLLQAFHPIPEHDNQEATDEARGAWFKSGFKRYFFTQQTCETWCKRRLWREAVSAALEELMNIRSVRSL